MVNRFTKIFFLYWFALVFLYAVHPFRMDYSLFKTVLLLPGHNSVIGVSWSLSFELYFYLLTGLVVYLVAPKYQRQVFLTFFITTTLVTIMNLGPLSFQGSWVNFLLGANLWEFLLGIGCAILATVYFKIIPPVVSILAGILSLLILLQVILPYNTPFSHIVYSTLATLVVLFFSTYEFRSVINKRIAGLIGVLGDASYAIYLLGPIITILIGTNGSFSKLLIIVVTISCSIFFNQLIENKLLKWSRRILLKEVATPKTVLIKA